MRWIWIDRFLEFESGIRAQAIKNITLAEDHLHDHFPGYPMMPNALIVEGLAQTGGILVGEQAEFKEMVILAKVPKAVFHSPGLPGDTLTYTTQVEYIKEDGAMISGTSHIGQQLQAEVEIVFAFLRDQHAESAVLDPKMFVSMMRTLGLLDAPPGGTLPPGLERLRKIGLGLAE